MCVQVTERMKACKHEETDCQLAQQLSHDLNLPYAEVRHDSPPPFCGQLWRGLTIDSIWHLVPSRTPSLQP